jgi:hypothetical protein
MRPLRRGKMRLSPFSRLYHSSLGSFVRRDPSGYEANDPNLYDYVFSNPTIQTDPAGLGQFGLTATLEDGQDTERDHIVNFSASFTPTKACPCKDISFIQVVQASSYVGTTPPTPTYKGKKQMEPFLVGNSHVDFAPWPPDNMKWPYYGAKPNGKGGWMDDKVGKLVFGTVGHGSGGDATMNDKARTPYSALFKYGARNSLYETCAVCIETKTVYACASWGFTLTNAQPTKFTPVQPVYSLTPSTIWSAAVDQYNTVASKSGAGWYQWPSP